MFPNFRIFILPNEDLSSYPLAMQLFEHILWRIFLQDLEKTIWLSFTFYVFIDSVKKMRTLMSHALPSQSHVDSLSMPFISLCVELQRWNNFYYFAVFSALKCLPELLLETFKNWNPYLQCSFL